MTLFSNQVIGNSDFLTGAFPAEYGNALAAVFDVKMRTGNTSRYEHTAQVGVLGLDFASEGPLHVPRFFLSLQLSLFCFGITQ